MRQTIVKVIEEFLPGHLYELGGGCIENLDKDNRKIANAEIIHNFKAILFLPELDTQTASKSDIDYVDDLRALFIEISSKDRNKFGDRFVGYFQHTHDGSEILCNEQPQPPFTTTLAAITEGKAYLYLQGDHIEDLSEDDSDDDAQTQSETHPYFFEQLIDLSQYRDAEGRIVLDADKVLNLINLRLL